MPGVCEAPDRPAGGFHGQEDVPQDHPGRDAIDAEDLAAFTLNEHPRIVGPRRHRYHSPLVSAEWCAFTNVPGGRGLINFAPEEEALTPDAYRTWARLFTQLRYYSWIVDRFHLSTRAYQLQHHGRDYDFTWLEDQLRPLGLRVALLTRSPESFVQARADRLKVSGKPDQDDDLQSFVREKGVSRELAAQTTLPWREFDIADNNVGRVAEEMADWLEQTGGMWMADD
jgi:hypothetical protein